MQTRGYWKWQNQSFRDEVFGPAEGLSIWQYCPHFAEQMPDVFHVFKDEFYFQTATKAAPSHHWTVVEDDPGGAASGELDEAGGWYAHGCDGNQHDESYVISVSEAWKFAAAKALWFEARVRLTEKNVNQARYIVGLMDAAGADALIDAGGPAASYDGAVFFKEAGALVIGFETSNAGAQVTTANVHTFVSGDIIRLGFMFFTEGAADATALIYPFVNGVIGTAHTITLAGLEEMHAIFGVKAGNAGDTNEEQIDIDYMRIVQVR